MTISLWCRRYKDSVGPLQTPTSAVSNACPTAFDKKVPMVVPHGQACLWTPSRKQLNRRNNTFPNKDNSSLGTGRLRSYQAHPESLGQWRLADFLTLPKGGAGQKSQEHSPGIPGYSTSYLALHRRLLFMLNSELRGANAQVFVGSPIIANTVLRRGMKARCGQHIALSILRPERTGDSGVALPGCMTVYVLNKPNFQGLGVFVSTAN